MRSYVQLLILAIGATAFALRTSEASGQCGNLIKSINFEGEELKRGKLPYAEELAYRDWAPYTYLDGFFADPNTRGSNNRRAYLVETDQSTALEVLLPEGCVTGECAMQAKNALLLPVESATLKFKMKFGPNFDWVDGGKLPGLCGAECLTGCKNVTGLDGWSSRQMWRPCVWPPENKINTINCSGGKLVAYVYHMYRDHWCGDDFEYSNDLWAREYKTDKTPVVPKSFFQPNPDEWYTVWSHIQMNTAGPPGEPAGETIRDGKLQTWLQVPGQEPLLVVDQQNMGWRVYNNVSIDTLYFSVFYGGSSDRFKAQKDETILFDDIQVWEGRCAPENEPFSQTVIKPLPEWDGMIYDGTPSALGVTPMFERAYIGGGCGRLEIENGVAGACDKYELQLSIRPSWGSLDIRDGDYLINDLEFVERDEEAGWFLLKSPDDEIAGKETVERATFCVRNYSGAKYLPDDLSSHVVARAFCLSGPAVELQKKLTADAVKTTLVQPRPKAEREPKPTAPPVEPESEPPPELPEPVPEPETPEENEQLLTQPAATPDPVAKSTVSAEGNSMAEVHATGAIAAANGTSAAGNSTNTSTAASDGTVEGSESTEGSQQGSSGTNGENAAATTNTTTTAKKASSSELTSASRSQQVQQKELAERNIGTSAVWFIVGGVAFLAVAVIVGAVAKRRLRQPAGKAQGQGEIVPGVSSPRAASNESIPQMDRFEA